MRKTSCTFLIIPILCFLQVAQIRGECTAPLADGNRVLTEDSIKTTYPDGSTAKFQCSIGYLSVDPSASKTITCTRGVWSELKLQCKKKSCGSLDEIQNGKYLFPEGIEFGATITAECNDGYLLVGSKTRSCLDSGWDGKAPICEVIKCSKPGEIQNGKFEPVYDLYDYNHAIRYSCNNKELTLVGKNNRTCSEDGTFRPEPPQCLDVDEEEPNRTMVSCPEPDIKNADRVGGKAPPYGYKNFVEYKCHDGYTMKGSSSVTCDVSGWNPSPPECIESVTPPPPMPQPTPTPSPHPRTSIIIIAVLVILAIITIIGGIIWYKKRNSSREVFVKVESKNEEQEP